MLQIIIQAIHNRKVLSITYGDKIRVIEPHRLGISTAGHNVLSAYQTSPSTTYDLNHTNWRLFDVAKITNINMTGAEFVAPRPLYAKSTNTMTYIYAEL